MRLIIELKLEEGAVKNAGGMKLENWRTARKPPKIPTLLTTIEFRATPKLELGTLVAARKLGGLNQPLISIRSSADTNTAHMLLKLLIVFLHSYCFIV